EEGGVAVRRRLRGAKGAGRPSGADDILDQEFLAEMPRENIGDDSARDIGGPAGGKRHDDGHGPCGIVLGPHAANPCDGHQSKDHRSRKPNHRQPPWFISRNNRTAWAAKEICRGTGVKTRCGRSPQAMAMSSSSLLPGPTVSPTALPIRNFATGEANEIEPAFGSASSSPTMRNVCTRPSCRLNVTVLPKATTSADEGLAWTWAVRSRSEKYRMSRLGIAESRRFSLTSSVVWAAS